PTYAGTRLAPPPGGTGATPLVVTLTRATATPAAVQALIRAIQYSSTADSFTTLTRTVTFTINDGDGGATPTGATTATVSITAVNDAPVVTNPSGALAYTGNGPAAQITAGATVSDADSTDFNGGALTVAITAW